MRIFATWIACLALGLVPEARALERPSRLERELEPEYASAIIELRRGASREAARSFRALIGRLGPEATVEEQRRVLELEAMALADQGDDRAAREIHARILSLLKQRGLPERDGAASRFQLALLDLKAGDFESARRGLEQAHDLDYDPVGCHLFLGFLDYRLGSREASARHFRRVLDSPAPAGIRALAALHLSRLASADGQRNRSLRYARDSSVLADSPEVREQAERAYREGSVAPGFHRLTAFGIRYDSNSAFLPGSNPTDSGLLTNEGPDSVANDAFLRFGYESSPASSFQWSAVSRTRVVARWNRAARQTDFLAPELELGVALSPLEEISFGFRAGIGALWSGEGMSPYRLQGVLGPWFRREIRSELVLLAEALVRPTRNYLDPSLPDRFDRSGPELELRASLFADQLRGAWNPGLSVLLLLGDASGTEFRSRTISLELDNPVALSDRLMAAWGAQLGTSAYLSRVGGSRHDPFASLRASVAHVLREPLRLKGEASYLADFSNLGSPYRFSRFSLLATVELDL